MKFRKTMKLFLCVTVWLMCLLYSCADVSAEAMMVRRSPTESQPTSRVEVGSMPPSAAVVDVPPLSSTATLGTEWARVHHYSLLDREFASMTVSNTRCPMESVRVPSFFPREGMTVWLLCYTTPTAENSTSVDETFPASLAARRPIEVTYTWKYRAVTPPFPMEPVAAVPDQTGPWTSAVLVALPTTEDVTAYFNVRSLYYIEQDDYSTTWAAEPHIPPRSVDTYGQLRAWRLEHGRMVEQSPRPIANGCMDELSPNFGLEDGASLLPAGERCQGDLLLCPPGRFHCDFEP